MSCDNCHGAVPTSHVELQHNVGMLFMRREYKTTGDLCRPCLHRAFRHHTFSNLALGWWGTISFFVTWHFLYSNGVAYARALRELSANPRVAPPPRLILEGEEAHEKLSAFRNNIRMWLRAGETPDEIGRDLSATHDVSVSDARAFVEKVRLGG
jgi:hypothetical protein